MTLLEVSSASDEAWLWPLLTCSSVLRFFFLIFEWVEPETDEPADSEGWTDTLGCFRRVPVADGCFFLRSSFLDRDSSMMGIKLLRTDTLSR